MRRGDIILMVDDEEIETPSQLATELTIVPAGSKVRFRVKRRGKTLDFVVQTEKYVISGRRATRKGGVWTGLVLGERNGELVVESVVEGSPAARAGVKADDVILEADGKEVKTTEQFEKILEGKSPGETLKLMIRRRGWVRPFSLKLEPRKE